MSHTATLRWNGTTLRDTDPTPAPRLLVADSWLTTDGRMLAHDLHRDRFLATATRHHPDARLFWDAAIAAIPRTGDWFPRVDAHHGTDGLVEMTLRLRPPPPLTRSITLTTHRGPDPRREPRIKGPSLHTLARLRDTAHDTHGADDTVILDPHGHITEGTATALVWWRGDTLCMPPPELDRVDSVNARALTGIAIASGTPVTTHAATPHDLDGLEIWALNALHGPRIVTHWHDGPAPAEQPGRLSTWRARLAALRQPLPTAVTA